MIRAFCFVWLKPLLNSLAQASVAVSSVVLRVQIAVLTFLTACRLFTNYACLLCFVVYAAYLQAWAKHPIPPGPEQPGATGWVIYPDDSLGFARLAHGHRAFLTFNGFYLQSPAGCIGYGFFDSKPARWQYLGSYVRETVYQGSEVHRALRHEQAVAAGIYPGVSVRAIPRSNGVKYEFIVAPGYSARPIQLELSGGTPRIEPLSGNLEWILPDGSTRYVDSAPVAWQADGTPVACRFVLNPERNILSFDLAPYDSTQELTIDPYVQTWGLIVGGSGEEGFVSTAWDQDENLYVVGFAANTDLTFGSGFRGAPIGGPYDVLVVKFSPEGKQIWATYLGGSRDDQPASVQVDSKGRVWVVGFTNSENLPVTPDALQPRLKADYDSFVAQFDKEGQLVYLSYFGGSHMDMAHAAVLDSKDNLIFAGTTSSGDFPKIGAYSMEKTKGLADAFVAKLSPDRHISWSTCYGGKDDEEGLAVAVNDRDDIFLTGHTKSADLPTSKNAFRTDYKRGGLLGYDAFALKLTATGKMSWATYLGGNLDDELLCATVDENNRIWLAGYTLSRDLPVTPKALQKELAGESDVFITCLSPAGKPVYTSYYGGEGKDYAFSITADAHFGVIVAGRTLSKNILTKPIVPPTNTLAGTNGFVARLDRLGQLDWGFRMGGTGDDEVGGIALSRNQRLGVVGRTTSTDFQTTNATAKPASGKSDGFVFRYEREDCKGFTAKVETLSPHCKDPKSGRLNLIPEAGTPPYRVRWSSPLRDTTPAVQAVQAGTYSYRLVDKKGCTCSGTVKLASDSGMELAFEAQAPICTGEAGGYLTTKILGGRPPYQYAWDDGSTKPDRHDLKAGIYAVSVTDQVGCIARDTFRLSEPDSLKLTFSIEHPSCFNLANGRVECLPIGGTPPYRISYEPGDQQRLTDAAIPVVAPVTNLIHGLYTAFVTDSKGCKARQTFRLLNPPELLFAHQVIQPTCGSSAGGTIILQAAGGHPPYTYQDEQGTTTDTLRNLPNGTYRLKVVDVAGCIALKIIQIEQPAKPEVLIEARKVACSASKSAGQTYLEATVSGGTPPYTYRWSTDSTRRILMMPSLLKSDSIYLTVTDAAGCVVKRGYKITEDPKLSIHLTIHVEECKGSPTYRLRAMALHGREPYTWRWRDDPTTEAERGNLLPGLYTVTVRDAEGCQANASVRISAYKPLSLELIHETNGCIETSFPKLKARASYGVPPYRYHWSNGMETSEISLSGEPQTLKCTVTDSLGCTQQASYDWKPVERLAITTRVTPITCPTLTDATIEVVVLHGKPPYKLTWSDRPSANSDPYKRTQLKPGVYSLAVTDATGCERSASVEILPFHSPVIQPSGALTRCQNDSPLMLSLPEGYAMYNWSDGKTGRTRVVNRSGTYTATLKTAKGCEVSTEPVSVVVHPVPEPPTITSTGVALQASKAETWSWFRNDSVLVGREQFFKPVLPGLYTVEVRNASGCTARSAPYRFEPTATVPEVKVYPNPSTGGFYLEISEFHMPATCHILNPHGETVYEHSGGAIRKWLDFAEHPKGVYKVLVSTEKGKSEGLLILR
jgi:hypothetical protein